MTQNRLRPPNADDQRLLTKIMARRYQLGLTAKEAANRAAMDRSWWAHLEAGRSTRVATVARMGRALGMRLDLIEDRAELTDVERQAVGNLLQAYVTGQRQHGRRVPAVITSALAKLRAEPAPEKINEGVKGDAQ